MSALIRVGRRTRDCSSKCRATELCKHKELTYSSWAKDHRGVVHSPGGHVTKDEMRLAYLDYATSNYYRIAPASKQRALVKELGGKVKGRARDTYYIDVALTEPELRDSGIRMFEPVEDPYPALRTLRDAGLVTDRDRLNRSYFELGGEKR